MEDKFFELRYLKAKEELASFINQIPNKYGLTFILVLEMVKDLKHQLEIASENDRRNLEALLIKSVSKESGEKKDNE